MPRSALRLAALAAAGAPGIPGCTDTQVGCTGMVSAAASAGCSCLSDLSAYAIGIAPGASLAQFCCESCMVVLLNGADRTSQPAKPCRSYSPGGRAYPALGELPELRQPATAPMMLPAAILRPGARQTAAASCPRHERESAHRQPRLLGPGLHGGALLRRHQLDGRRSDLLRRRRRLVHLRHLLPARRLGTREVQPPGLQPDGYRLQPDGPGTWSVPLSIIMSFHHL